MRYFYAEDGEYPLPHDGAVTVVAEAKIYKEAENITLT